MENVLHPISIVAVLITCHNRRDTTLQCLNLLYAQLLPNGVEINVYLVDDGSTDGTSEAIGSRFPQVRIIQGTGDLFWCNGMRLAWDHAARENPDFYLWLNDDVELLEGAIQRLLSCWVSVVEGTLDGRFGDVANQSSDLRPLSSDDFREAVIVVGSCCDPEAGVHTYGGQRRVGRHPSKFVPILPTDQPVACDVFQGNVVLVPRAVYQKIGNMRPFRHAIGDTDYGCRARSAGCTLWVAPGFVATCEKNDVSKTTRWGRLRVLMLRLPPQDYYRFLKLHEGWRWILYLWRPYLSGILKKGSK